ncbi:MarR family transcriptional regulator [Nocardioides sp. JQ2195]|uniref:MarR family winged helix-turn-helix transcriptional regulator n=1 Tax=Nocardioides sp. JQ2195 TaxID=2592334 RepID=UPI00143E240E|nr:MarR family transcriptional regulator [Nocardioides sp. JQ2195]QIX26426.1 MarR family transcriptional regulator [Nocardioides sp. JQ2195]
MADDTGDLLQAVARALRRRYGAAMAEWDIAPGQARALRLVHELEGPRLSVIAERLRMAPRSATEVIDALESRGLAQRTPDPTDRRATCVTVTDAGVLMCARIDEARAVAADEFLGGLTARDREELDRILRLLVDTR